MSRSFSLDKGATLEYEIEIENFGRFDDLNTVADVVKDHKRGVKASLKDDDRVLEVEVPAEELASSSLEMILPNNLDGRNIKYGDPEFKDFSSDERLQETGEELEESERKRLEAQLESKEREIKALRNQVESADDDQEVSQLEEELKEKEERIDELEGRIERTSDLVQEKDSDLEQVEEERDELESLVEELEEKSLEEDMSIFDYLSAGYDTFVSAEPDKEIDLSSLDRLELALEQDREGYVSEVVEEAEEEVERALEMDSEPPEEEEVREELDSLPEKIESLENTVEQLSEEGNIDIDSYREDLENLKSKKETLEKKLEDAKLADVYEAVQEAGQSYDEDVSEATQIRDLIGEYLEDEVLEIGVVEEEDGFRVITPHSEEGLISGLITKYIGEELAELAGEKFDYDKKTETVAELYVGKEALGRTDVDHAIERAMKSPFTEDLGYATVKRQVYRDALEESVDKEYDSFEDFVVRDVEGVGEKTLQNITDTLDEHSEEYDDMVEAVREGVPRYSGEINHLGDVTKQKLREAIKTWEQEYE